MRRSAISSSAGGPDRTSPSGAPFRLKTPPEEGDQMPAIFIDPNLGPYAGAARLGEGFEVFSRGSGRDDRDRVQDGEVLFRRYSAILTGL